LKKLRRVLVLRSPLRGCFLLRVFKRQVCAVLKQQFSNSVLRRFAAAIIGGINRRRLF